MSLSHADKGGVNMQKGDIIAIQESIYIEYPGGRWKDHFTEKRRLYVLCDTPTNNGNVLLRNSQNIKRWYNVNVNKYQLVKGAAI